MKQEIRERLGQAAYVAQCRNHLVNTAWEHLSDLAREAFCEQAEAVVLALAEMIVPQFQYVAMVLTDRPVEITLGERTASWPKEEEKTTPLPSEQEGEPA